MTDTPDLQPFHKQFSVGCFNSTWDLIDKTDRTSPDEITMLLRAMTSLWHWTQRADCTPRNLSVGYWQVSRVLTLIGQGDLAWKFAELCCDSSSPDEPFYLAYAHEALARAASLLGHTDAARHHLAEAHRLAETVPDPTDREPLLKDLASIQP